jgi:hypothetical protein
MLPRLFCGSRKVIRDANGVSRKPIRDANGAPHTLIQTSVARHWPLVTRHCFRNSFVSPASTKCSRNPFVSPTYAKTGGWGGVILIVTYLKYVGVPTFPFREQSCAIARRKMAT